MFEVVAGKAAACVSGEVVSEAHRETGDSTSLPSPPNDRRAVLVTDFAFLIIAQEDLDC